MPKQTAMREHLKKMREIASRGENIFLAMPSESNSFRAFPLREIAEQLKIDDNDPLLVRALEAQQKADRSNPTSWLDMDEAVLEFLEAHCEIEAAWPPNAHQIEAFLQKIETAQLTATEVEEFRNLAEHTFRDWQPQYSPGFKQRIESALQKTA